MADGTEGWTSDRVRLARLASGLSRDEVANLTGIDLNRLNSFEELEGFELDRDEIEKILVAIGI